MATAMVGAVISSITVMGSVSMAQMAGQQVAKAEIKSEATKALKMAEMALQDFAEPENFGEYCTLVYEPGSTPYTKEVTATCDRGGAIGEYTKTETLPCPVCPNVTTEPSV